MLKTTLLALCVLFCALFSIGQFTYVDDAMAGDCGCHDITQDVTAENGSFYQNATINLNLAFSMQFNVNFGCDDAGGEGVAFVLQTDAWTSGLAGPEMGYGGMGTNVLAIEFDTKDNEASGEASNSDVPYDHISLQDNGDTDNDPSNPNNLLGVTPTQILVGSDNVEDCEKHLVQIDWSPGAAQTISVFVDGVLSLTYSGDMITNQFGGNPTVLWGWTGSTGSTTGSNRQIICTTFAPEIDIEADATYCDGDAIADLTVVSPTTGTINWYDNPSLSPSLGVGSTFTPPSTVGTVTYYATETETSLGCEGEPDSVVITINPIPPAPLISGTTEYCQFELPSPLVAETSYDGDVSWYSGPPPAPILSTLDEYNPPTNFPGTYSYFVTETAEGCEGPATEVVVTIKPQPDPPAVDGTLIYCEDDIPTPLIATPSMGGDISWFEEDGTFLESGLSHTPALTPGTVIVVANETLDGCTGDDTTITITVHPSPFVDVPESISICKGDEVDIEAENNGYDISWSTGDLGTPITYFTDTTTWVYVTATNPLCGFMQDSVLIIVNSLPYVAAYKDTAIGLGQEVLLYANSGAENVTFSWSPDPTECVDPACSEAYVVPNQATVYVVTATDLNGCNHKDTVLVDIKGLTEIFVPNVFSPNNDGSNDVLEVLGPRLFDFDFRIYDRWGKMVYRSSDQRNGWDGTFKGEPLSAQTFVYVVTGETILGEKIKIEGNVSIIK
jgi:gliding motility-associated-like protein